MGIIKEKAIFIILSLFIFLNIGYSQVHNITIGSNYTNIYNNIMSAII